MHKISVKYILPDARARAKKKAFLNLGLAAGVKDVAITDCYTIDKTFSPQQMAKALQLLANPLLEQAGEKPLAPKTFDWAIEIGFLPGVTDNVGNTAKETLEDGLKLKFKPGEGVYSSQVYFISFEKKYPLPTSPYIKGRSKISPPLKIRGGEGGDIKKIADSLHNPLIQQAKIKSFEKFKTDKGMGITVPKVTLPENQGAILVDLNVNDIELAKIGKQGILDPKTKQRRGPLSLDLENMKAIRDYFKGQNRKPTDVELESLAQTWSEHCKHTIFADQLDEIKDGLYKTYIKAATNEIRKKKASEAKPRRGRRHSTGGDFCVSVFTDNSGGIIFDDNYVITHKVETHNSPSALDPFGGAITGIVGVNRDALGFGLSAKPIINVYGFCLGEPDDKTELFRDKEKHQKLLSARRIMDGVIAGVNSGGNQSGIPTNLGFLYFDRHFRGKPLVFAGTVGLIPKKIKGKDSFKKQAKPGDYIVMLGGRVGQDGIHGATFSSESLNSGSPATAVQIGDPITQKKLSDALVKEARGLGLYNSLTDDGAGGLSCSVAEMAKECNGCEVNLDKVPLKYPGLTPWQIWISESQERMTLAVPKKNWKKFSFLMKRRGVEATVIGQFTNSGKCVVKAGGKKVMDVNLEFLHEGRARKIMRSALVKPEAREIAVPAKNNYSAVILAMLKRLNITGTEFVARQYDHEVQGSSVQKPLQGRGNINAGATVTRPVLTSQKGVVLACGLNPSYSEIDCYHMAACAVDTAIRNAVAAGADINHLALLDNFCWSSSQEPQRLYQLKVAVKACYDYAVAYGTPFISGKDSMFNDFKGFNKSGEPIKISVPPTLLVSAIGVVPDIKKTVSLDAKMPGDLIYVLGETHNELGGGEYYAMLESLGCNVPKVDAAKNRRIYKALYNCNQRNLVASAISVGSGGMIAALCKTLAGGGLGGTIDLNKLPGNAKEDYQKLFSESQGRILVTVDPKNRKNFEKLLKRNIFAKIGQIGGNHIKITGADGKIIADIKISDALAAYKSTFKDF
jgi:phosphoribosylformylglycinamidine synthase